MKKFIPWILWGLAAVVAFFTVKFIGAYLKIVEDYNADVTALKAKTGVPQSTIASWLATAKSSEQSDLASLL